MTEEQNLYIEIAEKIGTPIMLLIAGFYFGNKSKKVDVNLEKIKELNIVLANMLNSWHYLNKLSEVLHFQENESSTLIFPRKFLPLISLKSGTLNDNCFQELEQSIKFLKQYDPICYFELEGVGKKFDFVKTNYIIPFLISSENENLSNEISRVFLDKLLNDIEQHLRETAKQISKKTYQKIETKIQTLLCTDFKKLNEEFNYEYYEILLPWFKKNHNKNLTYEEFLIEFKKPEIQNELQRQFELIAKNGMEKVLSVLVESPYLSIEELEQKINS